MLSLPPAPPLLTPTQMRAAERAAMAAGTPALRLMERASAAAVAAIMAYAPRRHALVLVGPGNNGGDGYGVALGLAARGVMVDVAALAPARGHPASDMAALWTGPVLSLDQASPAPLVVDALFGTGLDRAMPEAACAALARLAPGATLVALDIVSNIDAGTGEALGPVQPAALTIAFGAAKPGHLLGAGARVCGRLVTADIGIALPQTGLAIVPRPTRQPWATDSHKYTRGAVLVVSGEAGRGGAARLAAAAALRSGAGLVTLIGPEPLLPLDAVMHRRDEDGHALLADPRNRVALIGPALQDTPRAREWLARLLGGTMALVLDAGALALVTPEMLRASKAPLVLTPHEGEFRALFGSLGPDRLAAMRAAAARTGAIVLLKGPQTLIASPDGRVMINNHASPALATAGSGDVLAGLIAGLGAQGQTLFEAAACAAWLHGEAGQCAPAGLVADDLPALIATAIDRL